jgi:hypothetical protein
LTAFALRRRRCSNRVRSPGQAFCAEHSTVWRPARTRQLHRPAPPVTVAMAGREAADAAMPTMNSRMAERISPAQSASAGNVTSAGASAADGHADAAAPAVHTTTADHVLPASDLRASSRADANASAAESRAAAKTGVARGAVQWSDRSDRAALLRVNGAAAGAAALNGTSQLSAQASRQGQHRRRPLTAKTATPEGVKAAEPSEIPGPTPARSPAEGARLGRLLEITVMW